MDTDNSATTITLIRIILTTINILQLQICKVPQSRKTKMPIPVLEGEKGELEVNEEHHMTNTNPKRKN